jgi:hypothetical protein
MQLCIKLRNLKGVIEPHSTGAPVPPTGTLIGVQSLFISVAATIGGRIVDLKLDMPKGAVQKLPGRCIRASKGWVTPVTRRGLSW